jgi:ABC-2 type transport system permease protein
MNSKGFWIAKWEFMEKVKSKAFIISLILMPILIGAMAILPTLFALKEDSEPIAIGIIDGTKKLVQPLGDRLDREFRLKNNQPNYLLQNLLVGKTAEDARSEGTRLIDSEQIEGYFFIPATIFDSGKVEYRSKNVGNFKILERFSRTIEQVIIENRLSAHGLDTALIRKLTASIDVKSIKVTEKGKESEAGFGETFATAYIGLLMLIFMVLTSGQLLVRSVVEEKSNRVIEVLLSSCNANELMSGKILGLSGLGILQMLVYALLGVALAMKTNMNILQPDYFLLTLLYAILGYLFYAAIFVAAGSPVTTEQEAQQITAYVSMLLVVPFGLMMLVMQNPNSLAVRILSFIPPLTPSIMVLRISIQMPSFIEILASIIVLIGSIWIMMWIAGRIFRVAILSYGKRASFIEILRWIRAK